MSNIHRRAALLVTAVDELFGTHTVAPKVHSHLHNSDYGGPHDR
jgi:hypothetical protein